MRKPGGPLPGRTRSKTIVFLAAPGTQVLDVAGPFQVFVRAAEILLREHPTHRPPYEVLLASSTRRRSVITNCGLVLAGTETFRTLRGPIDTLLVAGGSGVEDAAQDEDLLVWLRKTARRVRRIGSICTGAFLLAEAGLLDGKRAATHWKWAAKLADKFKRTTVDPDPIYIRDGNTYTSAGVGSGGRRSWVANGFEGGAGTGLVSAPQRGPISVQCSSLPSGFRSETDRGDSFLDPRQS
jgi:transcriptional regulator GlxA family with amidase domain